MNDADHAAPSDAGPSRFWGFWGTTLWGLAIGFVFVSLQSITILVGVFAASGNPSRLSGPQLDDAFIRASENGTFLAVATLITAVVCSGLIVGVVKLRKGAVLRDYLAWTWVGKPVFLKWAGFMVVFLVLSDLLTISMGRPVIPEFMVDVYDTARPVWLLWVALIVAAPLFEETFFRGFLMRGLEASFLGPAGAVVVTAALWALLHLQYDAYGILTIFAMGLVFGAARIRTGSLLVPMVLHGMANLAATVQAALPG